MKKHFLLFFRLNRKVLNITFVEKKIYLNSNILLSIILIMLIDGLLISFVKVYKREKVKKQIFNFFGILKYYYMNAYYCTKNVSPCGKYNLCVLGVFQYWISLRVLLLNGILGIFDLCSTFWKFTNIQW